VVCIRAWVHDTRVAPASHFLAFPAGALPLAGAATGAASTACASLAWLMSDRMTFHTTAQQLAAAT